MAGASRPLDAVHASSRLTRRAIGSLSARRMHDRLPSRWRQTNKRSVLPINGSNLHRHPPASTRPSAASANKHAQRVARLIIRRLRSCHRIHAQYGMRMIAHDRVGVESEGQEIGQSQQTLRDPTVPMLEGQPGQAILTAQPRASYADRQAMNEARSIGADTSAAWRSHGSERAAKQGQSSSGNRRVASKDYVGTLGVPHPPPPSPITPRAFSQNHRQTDSQSRR